MIYDDILDDAIYLMNFFDTIKYKLQGRKSIAS